MLVGAIHLELREHSVPTSGAEGRSSQVKLGGESGVAFAPPNQRIPGAVLTEVKAKYSAMRPSGLVY